MKTHQILMALAATLTCCADVPTDAQRLIDQRDKQVAEINRKFIQELQVIADRYERRGDLEAVEAISKALAGRPLTLQTMAGVWTYTFSGKDMGPATFLKDGVVTWREMRGLVRIQGRMLTIQWNAKQWHAYVLEDDASILYGVDQKGNFVTMSR